MPRSARTKSISGIYRVCAVGGKEKPLTRSHEDKEKLVAILAEAKRRYGFSLYAYCVSNNELHLLLREKNEGDLGDAMKYLLSSYTLYYNGKYGEKGSLLHDRFQSLPIETADDVKKYIRSVHQIPVFYGEYKNVNEYPYSSYGDYFSKNDRVDYSETLGLFGDEGSALSKFKIFHAFVELNDYRKDKRVKYTHEEIAKMLEDISGKTEEEVRKLPQEEKLKIAKLLTKKTDLSLRQIESVCHVSRTLISKNRSHLINA